MAPALAAPAGVDFLAMLAERQTALELRIGALSASFAAYTAAMPRPRAAYIALPQLPGAQLLDVRRRVLEAIAAAYPRHTERVFVRCHLGSEGPWSLAPGTRAAVVFVTYDSLVEPDPLRDKLLPLAKPLAGGAAGGE